MVADARAAADPGEPEIEEARLADAQNDADGVDHQRRRDHPGRAEDQEQFGRDHRIGDEIAVGDAGEHLRTRQRDEQGVPLYPGHG